MAEKKEQDQHVQFAYEYALQSKTHKLEARIRELEINVNLIYREAIAGTLDSVKYVIRQLEPDQAHTKESRDDETR